MDHNVGMGRKNFGRGQSRPRGGARPPPGERSESGERRSSADPDASGRWGGGGGGGGGGGSGSGNRQWPDNRNSKPRGQWEHDDRVGPDYMPHNATDSPGASHRGRGRGRTASPQYHPKQNNHAQIRRNSTEWGGNRGGGSVHGGVGSQKGHHQPPPQRQHRTSEGSSGWGSGSHRGQVSPQVYRRSSDPWGGHQGHKQDPGGPGRNIPEGADLDRSTSRNQIPGKSRRPDAQVYVPRARRQQQEDGDEAGDSPGYTDLPPQGSAVRPGSGRRGGGGNGNQNVSRDVYVPHVRRAEQDVNRPHPKSSSHSHSSTVPPRFQKQRALELQNRHEKQIQSQVGHNFQNHQHGHRGANDCQNSTSGQEFHSQAYEKKLAGQNSQKPHNVQEFKNPQQGHDYQIQQASPVQADHQGGNSHQEQRDVQADNNITHQRRKSMEGHSHGGSRSGSMDSRNRFNEDNVYDSVYYPDSNRSQDRITEQTFYNSEVRSGTPENLLSPWRDQVPPGGYSRQNSGEQAERPQPRTRRRRRSHSNSSRRSQPSPNRGPQSRRNAWSQDEQYQSRRRLSDTRSQDEFGYGGAGGGGYPSGSNSLPRQRRRSGGYKNKDDWSPGVYRTEPDWSPVHQMSESWGPNDSRTLGRIRRSSGNQSYDDTRSVGSPGLEPPPYRQPLHNDQWDFVKKPGGGRIRRTSGGQPDDNKYKMHQAAPRSRQTSGNWDQEPPVAMPSQSGSRWQQQQKSPGQSRRSKNRNPHHSRSLTPSESWSSEADNADSEKLAASRGESRYPSNGSIIIEVTAGRRNVSDGPRLANPLDNQQYFGSPQHSAYLEESVRAQANDLSSKVSSMCADLSELKHAKEVSNTEIRSPKHPQDSSTNPESAAQWENGNCKSGNIGPHCLADSNSSSTSPSHSSDVRRHVLDPQFSRHPPIDADDMSSDGQSSVQPESSTSPESPDTGDSRALSSGGEQEATPQSWSPGPVEYSTTEQGKEILLMVADGVRQVKFPSGEDVLEISNEPGAGSEVQSHPIDSLQEQDQVICAENDNPSESIVIVLEDAQQNEQKDEFVTQANDEAYDKSIPAVSEVRTSDTDPKEETNLDDIAPTAEHEQMLDEVEDKATLGKTCSEETEQAKDTVEDDTVAEENNQVDEEDVDTEGTILKEDDSVPLADVAAEEGENMISGDCIAVEEQENSILIDDNQPEMEDEQESIGNTPQIVGDKQDESVEDEGPDGLIASADDNTCVTNAEKPCTTELELEETELPAEDEEDEGAEEQMNWADMVDDDDEGNSTWDSLFDATGEALDPKLLDELTITIGKEVRVQKPQYDYYNYQPKEQDMGDYGHLLEIYDFSKELQTRDLLMVFKEYHDRGFDIKWVDDVHAIAIFSSRIAAQSALNMQHPLMKVRPLSKATRQTRMKAQKCAEFLEPHRPRPETTASVARSLVTGALGIKSRVPREKRDAERNKLREARDKKRNAQKQKKDAWEGNFGRCAMDQ